MSRARKIAARALDPAVAVALAITYLVILLSTVSDLGYARDEGFYFDAARTYEKWFQLLATDRHAAMQQHNVDQFWIVNSEHPALLKSLFALSNLYLQTKHHLFSMDGTSFRFPAMVLSSALIGVVYLWGRRLHGRAAGLVAAVSLAFFPRFFFQAHLACFDAPITALFAFTAFAYAESLRRGGTARPLFTGVLFGLALDTKHNAWFLPMAALVHLGLTAGFAIVVRAPIWKSIRSIVANIAAMVTLGPAIMWALWPWIWHDTHKRLAAYVQFHVNHEYYNMEFLGETYWRPPMPRGYAWVMTLATVPTIALLLFAVGFGWRTLSAWRAARRRDAEAVPWVREGIFIALCLGVCYAPWLSTNTPIFGGTKHWMPAYPFLCLFVAAGFSRALRGIAGVLAKRRKVSHGGARDNAPRLVPFVGAGLATLLGLLCIAAPMREALHAHPYGLTAYTPLVGGAPGAATLGLNRTFWGYTTGSVAPVLNRDVRPRGTLYIHDTAWPSWLMLQEDGRVRRDIAVVGSVDEAEVALYHHEMHMEGQEYQAWMSFGTVAPKEVGGIDGVPVILVYERPKRRR
jgi:4-amino-4-deoxy-L-arabinose transferase-like glycosyltransferase